MRLKAQAEFDFSVCVCSPSRWFAYAMNTALGRSEWQQATIANVETFGIEFYGGVGGGGNDDDDKGGSGVVFSGQD